MIEGLQFETWPDLLCMKQALVKTRDDQVFSIITHDSTVSCRQWHPRVYGDYTPDHASYEVWDGEHDTLNYLSAADVVRLLIEHGGVI